LPTIVYKALMLYIQFNAKTLESKALKDI